MMHKAFLVAAAIAIWISIAPTAVAQETSPHAESTAPNPRPHIAYLDKSKTIYVAEFETSSESVSVAQAKNAPIEGGSADGPKRNGTDTEAVVDDSRRVTKSFAESLLREIKKAGYKPKLLGSGEPQPDDGILLAGVFTRTGKDGQLWSAAIGPGQPAADIQLYVTTSNLLRPAKPLYEVLKHDASADAAPIKLNPDVATLKFSVAGNPSDKAMKKTAEQVVAELQRLTLQAESEGLAGSDDPLNKYSKP
jgi:hypothetical protein